MGEKAKKHLLGKMVEFFWKVLEKCLFLPSNQKSLRVFFEAQVLWVDIQDEFRMNLEVRSRDEKKIMRSVLYRVLGERG